MSVLSLINMYQLKVTLIGSKPPIWRRIVVPSSITLSMFHLVLQISMGWEDAHFHQFVSDGVIYGIQDDDFDFGLEIEDEEEYKLNQLLKYEKDIIKYEYDFGDGWEHKILLEKILPFDVANPFPSCIKGKGACPPEDCGGIGGYQELLETLNDPNDPEYESLLEWLGGSFDSEALNIKEVNEMLIEYVR